MYLIKDEIEILTDSQLNNVNARNIILRHLNWFLLQWDVLLSLKYYYIISCALWTVNFTLVSSKYVAIEIIYKKDSYTFDGK